MMDRVTKSRATSLAVAIALLAGGATDPVAAQDFFAELFGGDSGYRETPRDPSFFPRMNFGDDRDMQQFPPKAARAQRTAPTSRQAYCVRTCDGRYFPITGASNADRTENCNNFCPAAETQVYYGSSIESAATDRGKTYSALPTAFKYREALVAGCSCTGKDSVGLAHIPVEKDETIRKGDIVASPDGLVVANRSANAKGRTANFSPASLAIQQKFAANPTTTN